MLYITPSISSVYHLVSTSYQLASLRRNCFNPYLIHHYPFLLLDSPADKSRLHQHATTHSRFQNNSFAAKYIQRH